MSTTYGIDGFEERNLVIESIMELDGVTPEEKYQYRIGRSVAGVNSRGEGFPAFVYYPDDRVWRTNLLERVTITDDHLIIADNKAIYTFKRSQELPTDSNES